MGLFKKLTVRSKSKSPLDSSDGTATRPFTQEVNVPKQTPRPAVFTVPSQSPPPPPYALKVEPEDEDSDPGSILIGIDFGTT
jgi:hypothetical protein